jgi:hypothetical protein
MKNDLFKQNGETHVSYGTVQSVLEAGVLACCFPIIIEFPFKSNVAYLSGFSSMRNIIFVQNSSILVKGRRIVSLGRKPSMFQARRSCILYPCEN